MDIPWEPAGRELIATGSVTICQEFWRTFVRNSVMMEWIKRGNALLWTAAALVARESRNEQSALGHHEFVSGDVAEMRA